MIYRNLQNGNEFFILFLPVFFFFFSLLSSLFELKLACDIANDLQSNHNKDKTEYKSECGICALAIIVKSVSLLVFLLFPAYHCHFGAIRSNLTYFAS